MNNSTNRIFSATSGASTTTPDSDNANLTLSGAGFTAITNSTVTFTILDTAGGNNNSFSGSPAGPQNYTFYDNFVLTGVIVVPEPSAALLASVSLLTLLYRRR